MEQEMKKIPLSKDLINQIINYLASKPYREVASFIGAIHKEARDAAISFREVDAEGNVKKDSN